MDLVHGQGCGDWSMGMEALIEFRQCDGEGRGTEGRGRMGDAGRSRKKSIKIEGCTALY